MLEDKHTSQSGPISIDDVKVAIQEIAHGDFLKTNASAIRKHLMRGSNSTIQKHLDLLRFNAQQATELELHDDLPPMPISEMQMLWTAAAVVAKKNSYERLVQLQQERDIVQQHAKALSNDLDHANKEIDLLTAQFQELSLTLIQQAEHTAQDLRLAEDVARKALEASHTQNQNLQEQVRSLEEMLTKLTHEHELERLKSDTEKLTLEHIIAQQTAHQARLQKLLDQLQPLQNR
jgi:Plasmid replication region DNA-binding N-term